MTVTTGVDAGAAREILLRGPLTAAEIGLSFIGEGVLEDHPDFRKNPDGKWSFWLPPLPVPADAAEVGDVIVLILRTLEAHPSGMPDSSAPLNAALGARAGRVYAAARDALVTAGLVSVQDGALTDRTGAQYRVKPRPSWEPRWNRPTVKQEAPAPHPTPSGTAHGASSSSSSSTGSAVMVPLDVPEPQAPVELEPTAPKPERVVEKVAAPKPKPVVVKPATMEKPVAAPTPAPAPVIVREVVAATLAAGDPEPVVAALDRLTAATERQNDLMAGVVGQGRLEPSQERLADRNRRVLAQRIVVLLAAHGPLTKSDMTRKKLSGTQADAVQDALDLALAVGAIRSAPRSRWELVDAGRLGLARETLETELEAIRDRAAERAAREANARIAQHRDVVTSR